MTHEDDAPISTAWGNIAVHQGDDTVSIEPVPDILMVVVLAEGMVAEFDLVCALAWSSLGHGSKNQFGENDSIESEKYLSGYA